MTTQYPSPIPTDKSCRGIYTPTAPCGCGWVQTVGHHPTLPVSHAGLSWCPGGCGEPVAMPSPPEPHFCSREHEREAENESWRLSVHNPDGPNYDADRSRELLAW